MHYIVGDRKFVEIPGDQNHELPPLMVPAYHGVNRLSRVVEMASDVIVKDELLPLLSDEALLIDAEAANKLRESREMDLAITLAEKYLGLVLHWRWGESILAWINQCEITFETRTDLRPLLKPNLWPHAGRSSFVTLLSDKSVKAPGVTLQEAVGLRLTFRQPPPISFFSDQFLIYLNASVASSAYTAWAHTSPEPEADLPPERFTFQIVKM